jgi:ferrochelatase
MTPCVLLMAHGTPERPEQMEEYLGRVMTHRRPSPEFVKEMQARYATFGGRSPLTDICRCVAAALQETLGWPVRIGMRTWSPLIRDEAPKLTGDPLIGIALAPHNSRFSVGAYHAALREAAPGRRLAPVEAWHLEPSLIDLWVARIREKLTPAATLLFTAHSVPEVEGDPYPMQVRETAEAIAAALPGARWRLAWQSRSPAPGRWLEPDVDSTLATIKARQVLAAPIGFLSDHAEILYDLDVLHAGTARRLGIEWRRCGMPNDDPRLIQALASVARRAAAAAAAAV